MIRKIIRKVLTLCLHIKILIYRHVLSSNHPAGSFKIAAPTLFSGRGTIQIDNQAQMGYNPSPFLYSGYNHIEARTKQARIEIGAHTALNNNATIISEGEGVFIGQYCLIGQSVEIYDTHFHPIDPILRKTELDSTKKTQIKDNVFIGSGVKILKGVTIGENCVIGAGSVVTKSFPDNCIIAGNPAQKIRDIA